MYIYISIISPIYPHKNDRLIKPPIPASPIRVRPMRRNSAEHLDRCWSMAVCLGALENHVLKHPCGKIWRLGRVSGHY